MSELTIIWNWMFVNRLGYKCVVYYYPNYLGEYTLDRITMPMMVDDIVFENNYSLTEFILDHWKRTCDFGLGDTLKPQETYNAMVDRLIQNAPDKTGGEK